MRIREWVLLAFVTAMAAGCGEGAGEGGSATDAREEPAATGDETVTGGEAAPRDGSADGRADGSSDESSDESATGDDLSAGEPTGGETAVEATEIMPGLTMRLLEAGDGPAAGPGDVVVVHYTGWLHDPSAPDARGRKFDSSVDRGKPFEFTLGAGEVIRGWDEGVRGMQVGEIRELTIAPELAYGERGTGPIPPGATLVFEVELLDVKATGAT